MTGKLTVEGVIDLGAIRHEGRKENYAVNTAQEAAGPAEERGVNWDLVRTVVAGAALALGYGAELLHVPYGISMGMFAAAIVVGGFGNFRKAARSLPSLDFNMSVLMSVAVIGAALIGAWGEGAVVAFLYSASELLEGWTAGRARRSIRELMDIAPKTARVETADGLGEVPVEDIVVGDVMVVRPGEKLAMDGRVASGMSAVDEASITGESVPAEKKPGDDVYAGTLNTDGALRVEVTKLVKDTTIAKIVHLVEEAQTHKASSQAFVERFAAVYTPVVLALAGAIVLVPPLILQAEWGPWIYRGLTLLVVSCPCALVVSTPVAIVSAISNAARHGVLIKGGVHLERMGSVNAIAFDKTGTLSAGRPVVTDVLPADSIGPDRLLALAASLEAHSEHPLAKAIVEAAAARGLATTEASDFRALTGLGASAMIGEMSVQIGNMRLFADSPVLETVGDQLSRLQSQGKTAMIVASGQHALGIIAVADHLRDETATAVAALKRNGIAHTIMITGDNRPTAAAIAAQAGVDEFYAELLPEDKVDQVKRLLERYGQVAMVGDGVNDAPALATATVGIAMGGAGSDTALETADVALMADDLTKLPFAMALSRRSLWIIKQNITFALAIKFVAVALVFPGWLTLWLAILSDMGASLVVTLNGMRLLSSRSDEDAARGGSESNKRNKSNTSN